MIRKSTPFSANAVRKSSMAVTLAPLFGRSARACAAGQQRPGVPASAGVRHAEILGQIPLLVGVDQDYLLVMLRRQAAGHCRRRDGLRRPAF